MTVQVRTLCSGSSGNAMMVSDGSTRLLVDCGVRAQRRLRQMLLECASDGPPLTDVVVSHLHSDHICYASLRVFEATGVTVHLHRSNASGLARRHFNGRPFDGLRVETFEDDPFDIGSFQVRPLPVRHSPRMTTHAFLLTRTEGPRPIRVALATDLAEGNGLAGHFADADLICLESNHDPALLEAFPNPNSAYHLENSQAASLLRSALDRSQRLPAAVLLAHLSAQRNTPDLALEAMGEMLEEGGMGSLRLVPAPRFRPSEVFVLR